MGRRSLIKTGGRRRRGGRVPPLNWPGSDYWAWPVEFGELPIPVGKRAVKAHRRACAAVAGGQAVILRSFLLQAATGRLEGYLPPSDAVAAASWCRWLAECVSWLDSAVGRPQVPRRLRGLRRRWLHHWRPDALRAVRELCDGFGGMEEILRAELAASVLET